MKSVRVPFVLANTELGTMIVNRMDYHAPSGDLGVGLELLNTGVYSPKETGNVLNLLMARRKMYGDGVLAIDGGANIGAMTLTWAKFMEGWGHVVAVEAQERTFYALAGNLALNNIFHAQAIYAALYDTECTISVAQLDPTVFTNFGGASVVDNPAAPKGVINADVRAITVDSLCLTRCDLIKLDIEGAELKAIAGAKDTIARHHPVFYVEHIFCKPDQIKDALPGYLFYPDGMNTICISSNDKILNSIKINKPVEVA